MDRWGLDTHFITYASSILKNIRVYDPDFADRLINTRVVLEFLRARHRQKVPEQATIQFFLKMLRQQKKQGVE